MLYPSGHTTSINVCNRHFPLHSSRLLTHLEDTMASSSTQHSRTLNLGAQCPEGMVRCEFRLADGSTACYFEIWRCPHCHRQHGLPFIRLCSEHVGQPLCKRWSPKEVTLDFHECFCPAHQAAIRQKELEVWEQRKADEVLEAVALI